jgi:cyclic pyranopterin phosphate synthase
MPLDEYEWIDKKEILTFEEIEKLARLFVRLGVDQIRLTGGEPLVRRDIDRLVARLSRINGIEDLSLTTNGALLADQAEALKGAGLNRINVSLDTLDAERFKRITKRGDLGKVMAGLFAAKRAGFDPIKLNVVIERAVNDDEVVVLVEFAREHRFAIRFIEYMDVGNANHWAPKKLVPKAELLAAIQSRYPLREIGRADGSAPAVDYEFVDGGGRIGFVASVTEPFCSSCTRARLTADGRLVTCLFSHLGHDLKALLRGGRADEEIADVIASVWRRRRDRYSDERLEELRAARYDPENRKKIEMITLGG